LDIGGSMVTLPEEPVKDSPTCATAQMQCAHISFLTPVPRRTHLANQAFQTGIRAKQLSDTTLMQLLIL